ncbi:MAG: methyl-accepting chemotaxis protein [Candidatus Hodarchaeales archaeon]|jgi:methyl-accepting chemotaxis protein
MASDQVKVGPFTKTIITNVLLVVILIIMNLVIFLVSTSANTGFSLDISFFRSLFGLSLIGIIISVVLVIIVNYWVLKSIFKPLVEMSIAAEEFTKGNLSIDIPMTDRSDEISDLQRSMKLLLDGNISMVDTLKNASIELKKSAEEVAKTANEVNIQTEEITDSIIGTSLKNLEGLIKIIEEVTKQTKVLALNAAIEAAKAGEFGRGFSIVADNVRRLSDETKKNTLDIQNLISEIIQNLNEKVSNLHETFRSFAVQSEEFSASSEEVVAATDEQNTEMNNLTFSSEKLTLMSGEMLNIMERFKERKREVQMEIEKEEKRKVKEKEKFLDARSIKK